MAFSAIDAKMSQASLELGCQWGACNWTRFWLLNLVPSAEYAGVGTLEPVSLTAPRLPHSPARAGAGALSNYLSQLTGFEN